jgi:uncharacterized protein YlzI (FlbEa/FlbD family)
MFLLLPIIKYDDEVEDWTGPNESIDINPMHIATMESPEKKFKGCCVLTMITGTEYLVRLSRPQMRNRVKQWMNDNVLSKFYKDIKDQSN